MTTFTIPPGLRVRESSFVPSNQSVGGGASGTGFEQVIAGPGGRWKASLTFSLRTEGEFLAFRAFLAGLQGRANEVLVGPRDGIRPRNYAGQRFADAGAVPFAGGSTFAGGSGWASPPTATGTVAGAVQQATSLVLYPQNGPGVEAGHYIGIVDRIYMALRVATDSTGVQTVAIWPWLRAPVPQSQAVLLDHPVCRMRLATDDSGAFKTTWKTPSAPTIDLVESFDA